MNFQNDISFDAGGKVIVFGEHPSTVNENCCCIVSGNFEGIPQVGEAAGSFHRKNFCKWDYHNILTN